MVALQNRQRELQRVCLLRDVACQFNVGICFNHSCKTRNDLIIQQCGHFLVEILLKISIMKFWNKILAQKNLWYGNYTREKRRYCLYAFSQVETTVDFSGAFEISYLF